MGSEDSADTADQPFDLDDWLESVQGETVVVDAPDGFPEVASCYFMPPWARPHREFYCSECDRMRFPVFDAETDVTGHCPVCGNEPGILELGTDGTFGEVRPNAV